MAKSHSAREIADDPAASVPYRIAGATNNSSPRERPDELFTTWAVEGFGRDGGCGRHRRAVDRARAVGRVQLQIRQQPAGQPSVECRAKAMAEAIKSETGGRVELLIFPNNQLGSDTDMLSQIRSGGVEFFTLSGLILATLVPAASINGIGFAFPDYATVWKAMDGELGAYVRGEITKSNLVVMDRIWTTVFVRPRHQPSRSTARRTIKASRSGCRFRRCGPRCSRRSTPRRPRSISAKSIRRCRPGSSKVRKIRWP